MKFLINNKIDFNVAERTLSHGSETRLLSNPASRLLLVLIENDNRPVSRDDLLKKVWEDYGLPASGNSLTNNISILRRNLSELGEDDLIHTIPKQGVMLKTTELSFTEIAEDFVLKQQNIQSPILFKNKKTRLAVIFVSVAIIAVLLLLSFIIYTRKSDEWIYYKSIDKCKVFYHHGLKKSRVDAAHKSLTDIDYSGICKTEHEVYYDEARSDLNSHISDAFIAVCSVARSGHIKECVNYVEVKFY